MERYCPNCHGYHEGVCPKSIDIFELVPALRNAPFLIKVLMAPVVQVLLVVHRLLFFLLMLIVAGLIATFFPGLPTAISNAFPNFFAAFGISLAIVWLATWLVVYLPAGLLLRLIPAKYGLIKVVLMDLLTLALLFWSAQPFLGRRR